MTQHSRTLHRTVLASSIGLALIGGAAPPAAATDPRNAPASIAAQPSSHVKLPDIGGGVPRNRDPQDAAIEALTWLAQADSADAAWDAAIDQGLSSGLHAVRDTNLPFLGNVQGSVRWNDANNAFDIDLLSMYAIKGNGEGHNWLLQLGVHNLAQRLTVNSGLVYRWVDLDGQWLVGGNVFFDHDFDGRASRAGVGVEAATPMFRAFGNLYAPAGGWKVSPDDALIEERAARGYDLGLAWTPAAFDILDVQAKGSRWQGDAVDVFGNGQTERDPTVWSLKASLQPVPAFGISAEHRKVEGGGTDSIVALTYTYRFGQAAAQQFVAASKGQRNDLRQRALLPVEREKRIVMETRERYVTPAFAAASVSLSTLEGQALVHALLATGGTGALVYSLSGPDAALFTLQGTSLTLPAQDANEPLDAGADNVYDAIVTVTDANGRTASQTVRVEVLSSAPVAQNASVTGFVGTPAVGNVLGVTFNYHSPTGEAEDTSGRKVEWFREAPAQAMALSTQSTQTIIAEGPNYTVTNADKGHRIGARITVKSASGKLGTTVVYTAAVPGTNFAPTATVSLSGEFFVGSTLTGVYSFNDVDGDAEGASTFQWYRQDDATGTGRVLIAGANALQYTLTAADEGRFIVFEAIPVSTAEPAIGAAVTAISTAAVAAPTGTAPEIASVTIDGNLQAGQTLTATANGYTDADLEPEGTHLYQWYTSTDAAGLTDLVAIVGATQQTYVLRGVDQGRFVHADVSPRSQTGSPTTGTPVRGSSAAIVIGQMPVAAPQINGTAEVGQTLTATIGYSDPDGDAESGSVYHWFARNPSDGVVTQIPGTNGQLQYTITADRVGFEIGFSVEPRSATGTPSVGTAAEDLTSAVTARPKTYFENPTQLALDAHVVVNSPVTVSGRTGNAPSDAVVDLGALTVVVRSSLVVDLIAPSGTIYNVRQFQDAEDPELPVTMDLSSEQANGVWTLRVEYFNTQSGGTLDGWKLGL
jgi:hypothetical protein